jgi:hypothetical protein
MWTLLVPSFPWSQSGLVLTAVSTKASRYLFESPDALFRRVSERFGMPATGACVSGKPHVGPDRMKFEALRPIQSASNCMDCPGGVTMRLSFRNFVPLLLATVLAAPVITTGCRSHRPSEDDSYIQWEHETHRQHLEVNQRSADERKQYDDWRRSRNEH